MDYNQTFHKFPAAGFAPPFVPGFRSFSISSGRKDGELDNSLSITDIVIFLRQQFSIALVSQEYLGANKYGAPK